ncbi:MAG: VOC family protein [Candidatus Omnitrophota bacterium]
MKKTVLILCLVSLAALAGFVAEKQAAKMEFDSNTIQIGMIVSDLPASLTFYKEILGFMQEADRPSFDVNADFGKKSGLTDSLPIHVEVLKLGAGSESTQLKLMTFGEKAKKQENDYISTHTGVQYLTIRVKNLTPFVESIKKHNVKFAGETPIPLGDNHFVLVKDPDGTFVELIGPMK